jgi:phosphonoacetate hydrolase
MGENNARVILPITDPYVAHHGSLGSFDTVYLCEECAAQLVVEDLRRVEGIELAVGKNEACQRFEVPPDRVGDVVVISNRHKVLGTTPKRHDLSGLTEPLRSHGGLTEQTVPMIVNRKVDWPTARFGTSTYSALCSTTCGRLRIKPQLDRRDEARRQLFCRPASAGRY